MAEGPWIRPTPLTPSPYVPGRRHACSYTRGRHSADREGSCRDTGWTVIASSIEPLEPALMTCRSALPWVALLAVVACDGPTEFGGCPDWADASSTVASDVATSSCPPPTLPTYARPISGTVLDASLAPVSNATVRIHLGRTEPVESSECESDMVSTYTALTFPDGKYFENLRSPGSRRCVGLTVTRREDPAASFSFSVLDVTFTNSRDPAAATDTLRVNVVLPGPNP